MHIKQYSESDRHAVLQLHHSGLNETGVHKGLGPWDDDLIDIKASYMDSGGLFLVGYLGDELAAMGGLQRLSTDIGIIKRMHVQLAHRRKGLGQEILRQLLKFAYVHGYSKLKLDTTDRQVAAQRLYQKHGFRETHREAVENAVNIFFELDLVGANAKYKEVNGHIRLWKQFVLAVLFP